MKTQKPTQKAVSKKNPKINWAIPGLKVLESDIEKAIQEAEAGAFHSVQQSMTNFEQWLTSREKK